MAERKEGAKGQQDLQKELRELRAQVAALSNAKQAEVDKADSSPLDDDAVLDFDGLIESLKAEIEELPAMTSIALFTLGILVGRLLSH